MSRLDKSRLDMFTPSRRDELDRVLKELERRSIEKLDAAYRPLFEVLQGAPPPGHSPGEASAPDDRLPEAKRVGGAA